MALRYAFRIVSFSPNAQARRSDGEEEGWKLVSSLVMILNLCGGKINLSAQPRLGLTWPVVKTEDSNARTTLFPMA